MIALAGSTAFIGCGEVNLKPTVRPPSYSVTIDQLAARLGLTVQKAGSPYYELTNANNRVLLFTYKNGRVYVNGKAVCPIGTITETNGSTYVSQLLIPEIRANLDTSYTPKVVTPTYRTASGTVVVDPGHGGKKPGAQSVLGYWEKGVNLEISHKLAQHLRKAGVNVVMTRENDSHVTLEGRAALANRINADLFVSIHCNTISKSSYRGFIIFTARSASWTSKKTAKNISRSLSKVNVPSRGLQNQDFKVLVQTRCPAVLVECGFMTNHEEARLLTESWYQDKLARAIADGIINSL
jgi:N-acetylmuramoyl-L-alanine amidase